MSNWDLQDDNSTSNPPPQKRTKSSELFKKQHGFSPERLLPAINPPLQQHALTRERRSKSDQENRDREKERDRSMEFKDSLLGQALEGGPTLIVPSQVINNSSHHPLLISLLLTSSTLLLYHLLSHFPLSFSPFTHHTTIRLIRICHLYRLKVLAKTQTPVMMPAPIAMMTKWMA